MTEIQGVIGRIQVARMPKWQAARLANANRIWDTCRKIDWLRVPEVPKHIVHGAYKAYVFVRPDRLPRPWDRDTLIDALSEQGIPAFSGSCSEVYREKAFNGTGFRPARRLPGAKELGENSLMFLVHPTLEPVHIDKTCRALEGLASRLAGLSGSKTLSTSLG